MTPENPAQMHTLAPAHTLLRLWTRGIDLTATHAIIGVDIGATTMAAGLVTRTGDVLHAIQCPTHRDGRGTALATLLACVRELVAHTEARRLTLDGVGIGVAGVVDPSTGMMQPHPNNGLPELAHVSLVDAVRQVTSVPVFVDNDANALALAEWIFGVGRGAHSLVLMAIGTAIGGGIIVGDRVHRGAHGSAGELHAIPVAFDGRFCFCGARGCLGAYVEGRAIVGEARERLAGGAPSSLPVMAGGDPARVTPEIVFRAAAEGDPLAKAIVDGVCDALGAGIAAIVNTVNPEVVVVTGGVARSLVPLEADVRRRVATHTFASAVLERTRIHVVAGDKHQTMRGGAALVVYEAAHATAAAAI